MKIRGHLVQKQKVGEEEHMNTYGGVREEIGMKTYLHGSMGYAETLKLRFGV